MFGLAWKPIGGLAAAAALLATATVAGGESLPAGAQQPAVRAQHVDARLRAVSARRDQAAGAVVIQAYDFGYNAPDAIPSGVVNFRILNSGTAYHMAQFLLLNDGVTADDVLAAMENGAPDDAFTLGTPAGGVNAMDSGEAEDFTLTMTPGNYVMLDFVSGDDGIPYAEKGSIRAFTVTDDVSPAVAPDADLTITAQDDGFTVPPITPGTHMVQFINQGSNPHELSVIEFAPPTDVNQQAADQAAEYETEPYGGVAVLAPGQRAWAQLTFNRGIYEIADYYRDAATGLPNAALGLTQFVVVADGGGSASDQSAPPATAAP